MPVTDVTTDPEALTMTLTAEVAASVDRLWGAFTDPRQLERFWGPPGYPATFTEFDLSVGGRAHYRMTSPQGEQYHGVWEFLEIDGPRSFTALDSFADADGRVLAETERIELVRDLTYDDSQLLAKGAEETLLYRDMDENAAMRILRRLQALKPANGRS